MKALPEEQAPDTDGAGCTAEAENTGFRTTDCRNLSYPFSRP